MKDINFSKSVENEDVFSWKHNDEGLYTFVIDEDGDVIINYTPYSSKKKTYTHFIDADLFNNSENETGVSGADSKDGVLHSVMECNAHGKTDESISATDECGYEKITDDENVFFKCYRIPRINEPKCKEQCTMCKCKQEDLARKKI